MAEMTQERMLAGLETLHSADRAQVPKLGNTEASALMEELDHDRLGESLGRAAPGLAAWWGRHPRRAGASCGACFIHTTLASQERGIAGVRDAAAQCRSVL